MKPNQVFVLVRDAEDSEFEIVEVLQSVHQTRASAERRKLMLEQCFNFQYEILKRNIEND